MVHSSTGKAQRRQRVGLASTSKSSLFSSSNLHLRHEQCKLDAKLTCRTVCRDYCNKTAVHGFRYFFEEGRTVQERAFWILAVLLCFGMSLYLISKIWIKWETYPVIVTFADHPTNVWDIPFPAVTICPSTKTKRSLFNFTLAQHRVIDNTSTEEEIWKYQALSLVCESNLVENVTFDESALQFVQKVAPSIEEVVAECSWQSRKIPNCSNYFREVMTEDGVCFSFNMLRPREIFDSITVQAQRDTLPAFTASGWNIESGYDDTDPHVKRFYPLRQVFVGPNTGLMVILHSKDEDMDYVCRGCEQGFRVYLHNPGQSALSFKHQLLLPLNASMMLLAKPTVMMTSDGLREYSPDRRRCFFPEERKLFYFKWYSQENCIYECFSNISQDKCGCAPSGLPRRANTPVCPFMSKCLVHNFGPIPVGCGCMPTCTSLDYGGEPSVVDYPWEKEGLGRRQNRSTEGISMSRLQVYYENLHFITVRRTELYGHTDFLANFGGLLGLFTGFSVISMVEIVYYASLRLWCDLRRRAAQRRQRDLQGGVSSRP